MNMQLYHQVAVINNKVKALRAALEQVESQQATLEQLLQYRPGSPSMYPVVVPVMQDRPGDAYIENLVRIGTLT